MYRAGLIILFFALIAGMIGGYEISHRKFINEPFYYKDKLYLQ